MLHSFCTNEVVLVLTLKYLALGTGEAVVYWRCPSRLAGAATKPGQRTSPQSDETLQEAIPKAVASTSPPAATGSATSR